MRNRIWSYIVNIKFKELYTCECSRLSDLAWKTISFFIAITSASSIASWTILQNIKPLWAIAIAAGQLVSVAKPFIPFIKQSRKYMEMSFEYSSLYLNLEKLWYKIENQKIDHDTAEELFYNIRDNERKIDISYKDVHCPQPKWLIEKIETKTLSELKINFP